MAIAFDTSTLSTAASFSHTCTGSNRALVFWKITGGADNVSITYGGVSMTKQNTQVDGGGNRLTLFTLLNPASGSNTLAVTNGDGAEGQLLSYTGVTAVSGAELFQNSGASITCSIDVAVANSWCLSGGTSRTGPHDPTPSTGVTNDRSGAATQLGCGDSGPESIGTVSHTWLNDGSNENTINAIVLEPLTGANYTLAMAVGSFVLTGFSVGISLGFKIVMGVGNFVLTGYDLLFRRSGWENQSKNNATATNQTKNSSTWTNLDKS